MRGRTVRDALEAEHMSDLPREGGGWDEGFFSSAARVLRGHGDERAGPDGARCTYTRSRRGRRGTLPRVALLVLVRPSLRRFASARRSGGR